MNKFFTEHFTPKVTTTGTGIVLSLTVHGISGETRGLIIAGILAAFHIGEGLGNSGLKKELQAVTKKLDELK